MKTNFILLSAVLITLSAAARVIENFRSWDELIERSSFIAVVRCGNPTPQKPNVRYDDIYLADMEIHLVANLKNTTNAAPVRILTDYLMCSGENYLVFGTWDSDVICSYERYRVVPLDKYVTTNLIAGKTLQEQIQILLQRRLDNLKLEMQENENEKMRLEAGLKKPEK
jgi:hypothetical protein